MLTLFLIIRKVLRDEDSGSLLPLCTWSLTSLIVRWWQHCCTLIFILNYLLEFYLFSILILIFVFWDQVWELKKIKQRKKLRFFPCMPRVGVYFLTCASECYVRVVNAGPVRNSPCIRWGIIETQASVSACLFHPLPSLQAQPNTCILSWLSVFYIYSVRQLASLLIYLGIAQGSVLLALFPGELCTPFVLWVLDCGVPGPFKWLSRCLSVMTFSGIPSLTSVRISLICRLLAFTASSWTQTMSVLYKNWTQN